MLNQNNEADSAHNQISFQAIPSLCQHICTYMYAYICWWSWIVHAVNNRNRKQKILSFHTVRIAFQSSWTAYFQTHTTRPVRWVNCVDVNCFCLVQQIVSVCFSLRFSFALPHTLHTELHDETDETMKTLYIPQANTKPLAYKRSGMGRNLCVVQSVARLACVVVQKWSVRISFPKSMFWTRLTRNIQWLRFKATRRVCVTACFFFRFLLFNSVVRVLLRSIWLQSEFFLDCVLSSFPFFLCSGLFFFSFLKKVNFFPFFLCKRFVRKVYESTEKKLSLGLPIRRRAKVYIFRHMSALHNSHNSQKKLKNKATLFFAKVLILILCNNSGKYSLERISDKQCVSVKNNR